MKLSIIIPVAGNNHFRNRNFEECLKCIKNQEFNDYEVIVVEQSLDGRFYKGENPLYQYVQIKDPQIKRGFNLSWCRNVGARAAKGEKIVLMDADMVFEKNYFDAIDKCESPFAGGAEEYFWIREEMVTQKFIETGDFNYVYEISSETDFKDSFRFKTFTKGCGYGAVLFFDKKWYWEVLGGYPEDFFRYGWEDKAVIEIIKYLLGVEDSGLSKIDYRVVHLSHGNKDYANLNLNESIYNSIKNMDKDQLIRSLKGISLGSLDEPKKCELI
jgi:glycosyltransferase involved in cell wall biosynthesis